ncbi:MAG: hypothetical protein ACE5E4_07550 [Candidatus Binatia bacterium]
MGGCKGENGRTRVVVVGSESPGRCLAAGAVLTDCIGEHGWSERLSVGVAGFGSGAGRPSKTDLGALSAAGVECPAEACPALGQDPEILEEADVLVACERVDAERLIEMDESMGKQVMTLSELLGDYALPAAALDELLARLREAMPLLVRRLVATGPA